MNTPKSIHTPDWFRLYQVSSYQECVRLAFFDFEQLVERTARHGWVGQDTLDKLSAIYLLLKQEEPKIYAEDSLTLSVFHKDGQTTEDRRRGRRIVFIKRNLGIIEEYSSAVRAAYLLQLREQATFYARLLTIFTEESCSLPHYRTTLVNAQQAVNRALAGQLAHQERQKSLTRQLAQ